MKWEQEREQEQEEEGNEITSILQRHIYPPTTTTTAAAAAAASEDDCTHTQASLSPLQVQSVIETGVPHNPCVCVLARVLTSAPLFPCAGDISLSRSAPLERSSD